MCGICGVLDIKRNKRVDKAILKKITEKLIHRGPDDENHYLNGNVGLGFTRLSIIDIEGGQQPIFNEDGSVVVVCNGEIFNYIELREELAAKGHRFKTRSDVEVLVHLYEEEGIHFLNKLNGQFGFAIYDFKKRQMVCARDHFGVIPFYYTQVDGYYIFASEIKAILEHPSVKKEIDPVALDQVFSFPGLISPRTIIKNIYSLENGHYHIVTADGEIKDYEYWDVVYPEIGTQDNGKSEQYYIEGLEERLTQSIKYRLRSDVPVGFYISGGLDSSIITAMTKHLTPGTQRNSFSIDFEEREISEAGYQRQMARHVNSIHHDIKFCFSDISTRLPQAVYHSECPLKETYNTASLALSRLVRNQDIKVILTGEGSDEFFAGYVGYRFDKLRQMQEKKITPDTPHEDEIREKLWGDKDFFYEKNQWAFRKIKRSIYSRQLNRSSKEFDSINHYVINQERIKNRHILHQRSYLDYKLRLVDHLVSDHGDRMAMANSVEARYPFLDKELVEFAAIIPPDLKLMDFNEKYILKRMAEKYVPREIVKREKFGFVAPGSPYLLNRNIEYINDILSFETIKRQGYFDADAVEYLKKEYMQDGFKINAPFDSDLLVIVLTFGILLEKFQLPNYH